MKCDNCGQEIKFGRSIRVADQLACSLSCATELARVFHGADKLPANEVEALFSNPRFIHAVDSFSLLSRVAEFLDCNTAVHPGSELAVEIIEQVKKVRSGS